MGYIIGQSTSKKSLGNGAKVPPASKSVVMHGKSGGSISGHDSGFYAHVSPKSVKGKNPVKSHCSY